MANYLAIDTAGAKLSVVLKYNGVLTTLQCPHLKSTASVLLPSVDKLLMERDITLKDLDYLAVTTGPGSFTGLRVGFVTVKAWGMVTGLPVVGVNSLQLAAYILDEPIVSIIDGSNGVAYVAIYKDRELVSPPKVVYAKDLSAHIPPDYKVIVDKDIFGIGTVLDPLIALPYAVEDYITKGKFGTHDQLALEYIRKSQPERGEGDI